MAKKKLQSKREEITLTIRARTNPDIDILNELKKETGLFYHSQALMKAASSYPVHLRTIRSLQSQINEQNKDLKDLKEIISQIVRAQRLTDGYAKKFLKNISKFPEQEIPFEEE